MLKMLRYLRFENVHTDIFTPRTYQVELLDKAIKRNTIVCLGSGSGKTFISILLIKELSQQLRKPLDQGGKRTVYLVQKENVVEYRAKALQLHTDLKVGSYKEGDEEEKEQRSGGQWRKELEENQVLVMSPGMFEQALERGVIPLSLINTLVFDSCHHVTETGHPYVNIMRYYFDTPLERPPRILGLTASLLNNQCKTPDELQQKLTVLQESLDSTAETASDVMLAATFGTKPKEFVLQCDEYKDETGLVAQFESIIGNCLYFLETCKYGKADTETDEKEDATSSSKEQLVDQCSTDNGENTSSNDNETSTETNRPSQTAHSPEKTESQLEEKDSETHKKISEAKDGVNEESENDKRPENEEVLGVHDACSLEDEVEALRVPRVALMECYNILHLLGPWCAGRVAETLAKQVEKLLEVERDEWCKRFLHLTYTQLNLISHMMTQIFDYDVISLEDFLMYVSPKVKQLLETLHEYKPNDNFVIVETADSEDDDASLLSDDDMDDVSSDDNDGKKIEQGKDVHYVAVKKVQDSSSGEKESKEESLCGLVFVERRHTAFILNKLLEEMCNWDQDIFFVKSHHFTGQGYGRGSKQKEAEMTAYKKQEEVLRKFRHREFNLLVCTGVLEEGVDIPRCNLVVRFDPPQHYRSYVQSKGRARASNSKFYLLVDETESEQFNQDLQTFKGFEKLMCHALQELDEERDEALPPDVDNLLPAYQPSVKDGALSTEDYAQNTQASAPKVTLSSAIALVNRYCAKLPSDAFTHLVPDCTVKEVHQDGAVKYTCTLQLPINSPVKHPIQGEAMDSKRLAKMAVALKTCEVLHKEGEIDEQFMPIGKEIIRYEDEDNEWEETEGQARPGTTKRKQYYLKKIASALLGRPMADKPCYLYIFNMKLTCPITEEQNTRGRAIYAPEDTPRAFAFLSERRIPLVPLFPVFTRSGEVTVSIDLAMEGVTFSPEEMKRFEFFHKFVFSRVLRLDKDPMLYLPSEAPYSCLIVPVQIGKEKSNDVTIDWKFIEKIENCPMKISGRKYVFQKRDPKEAFIYRHEEFADAVVMPSYRNIDQPQYFYVAETRWDINPKSPFPSPELFDTFEHYYNTKYGLQITNVDQPLLDVDHTSARLNLLTPRYMNQKGVALPTSSAETRRQKRENLQQKQILIPELCDVHPFPASLWRKAVCIPAILYRLNYLLIADEIRILISKQAKIGVPHLPYDYRFSQLEFSFPKSDSETQETNDDSKTVVSNRTKASNDQTKPGGKNQSTSVQEKNLTAESSSKTADDSNTRSPEEAQANLSHTARERNAVHENSPPKQRDCDVASTGDRTDHSALQTLTAKKLNINSSHSIEAIPSQTASSKATAHSGDVSDVCVNTQSGDVDTIVKNVGESGAISCDDVPLPNVAQSESLPTSRLHLDGPPLDSTSIHPVQGKATSDSNPCYNQIDLHHTQNNSLMSFDDEEIDLVNFIGPSPCLILQTLTMSNANDFFNLERLETIGDSFLKFAITVYLYCTYPGIHEGKLSYLRSKQVSNYNLYRLGKKTGFPECMVASKFEPSENWLPPGFVVKQEGAFRGLEVFVTSSVDLNTKKTSECYYIDNPGKVSQVRGQVKKWEDMTFADVDVEETVVRPTSGATVTDMAADEEAAFVQDEISSAQNLTISEINNENESNKREYGDVECKTQADTSEDRAFTKEGVGGGEGSNIEDKVKDGSTKNKGHLNGIVKIPNEPSPDISDDGDKRKEETSNAENSEQEKFQQELDKWRDEETQEKQPEHKTLIPYNLQTQHSLPDKSIADCVEALIGCYLVTCGQRAALQFMAWLGLKVLPEFINQTPEIDKKKSPFCGFQRPPSPLLTHVPNAHGKLACFLDGYEAFENRIDYKFADKSYLLQAFTHASYHYNNITDCYQRLEFLGDAILDYVITRHLFEDSKKHSPGILTDLRSALVNNNIFAALAVKWDFHKYFKAVSPHLFNVINKFVQWQKERGDVISLDEEFGENEESKEEGEDIEIPKALGDIFESVAGAVYLDSGMSLDVVWRVYYRMMKPYIDAFTDKIPKSPVRELLEMEPETAKFERPERTMDGKIRVTVTVVGKGSFRGVGRNYRIAKSAAAKRALKHIKLYQQELDNQMHKQMFMASLMQQELP